MNRPKIVLNFAISADAKISTRNGDPSGWTSAADTERYFQIRRQADAVLVGRGTQEADSMSLTMPRHEHWRCLISRAGGFDPNATVFQTEGGPIHLIVTDPGDHFSPGDWPAVVHSSLEHFLSHAQSEGIKSLLCEGGGQLVKTLATKDLIDEIHLTWAAHTLIGGYKAPTISGVPGPFLETSRPFQLTHFETHEESQECFLSYARSR